VFGGDGVGAGTNLRAVCVLIVWNSNLKCLFNFVEMRDVICGCRQATARGPGYTHRYNFS